MSRGYRSEIVIVGALLVLAFSVRFAYHQGEMWSFPGHPDGYEYHRLAQNFLRGRGYGWILGTGHFYRYARPSGYPFFIALVYSVVGIHSFALRFADLLLGVLSVLFAYLIGRRLFGCIAGILAAVLLCFYWRAVMFAADYLTENLFMCLILGVIYLVVQGRGRLYLCLLYAGLIMGYAVIVRPNAIAFCPALLLWIASRRLPVKARLLACIILLGASSIIPALWSCYHWGRYSSPPSLSLSSLVGARSLWQAHNPEVGDEVDNRGIVAANKLRFAHFSLPEREWASLLKDQAASFFRQDPGRCLRMSLLRFRKHWLGAGVMDGTGTIYPDTGKNRYGILYWAERFWKPSTYVRDNEYVSMHFKKPLMIGPLWIPLLTFEGLVYIVFLSLFLGCLLQGRKFFPSLRDYLRGSALLLLMIFFYVLFHFMGFVHHRIRFPLEPLICILGGGSLSLGLGGIVRLFTSRVPRWFYPEEAGALLPIRRLPAWIIVSVIVLLLFAGLSTVCTAYKARRDLFQKCALTPEEGEIESLLYGTERRAADQVDFETLQRYRAGQLGAVEPFVGKSVVWTGEATFLRKMRAHDLRYEPTPYREAWKMLDAGEAPEALFVRLVIGSYQRPDHHGQGEALLITLPERASTLAEGDSVTIEGRIAGADNDVMGYPIVAVDKVYRWPGNISTE